MINGKSVLAIIPAREGSKRIPNKNIKILISILIVSGAIFAQNLEYSTEDYNSTSPTYGLDVWHPEYLDYITLHYFSSQG